METGRKSISSFSRYEIDTKSYEGEKKRTGFMNKFRWNRKEDGSPKEIYNRSLYLSVLIFGVLGCARGYDEGNISGSIAQKSFKDFFGLSDTSKTEDERANLKSNITAMVQLGSIGGSLIAMFSVDGLGRVRALQCVCVIWIVGAIIQITSQNVGQLYAGRLIEGLAIGQTTTIGPAYLSEVAPKAIRGLCGCIFAGAVYLGVMLAYFANYGTALHISENNKQWIIPTSLKIPLAGIILIYSIFFCIESPRWFFKANKKEKGIQALCKLRNLPRDNNYMVGEVCDILEHNNKEKEVKGGVTWFSMVRDIILDKSIAYRFFAVSAASQIIGQWSGSNAITIYANELFALSGIVGVETLKMTAILGVCKFVGAYFTAFFLIDTLGRKRTLYAGICIQFISTLYYAIFLTLVPQAAKDGADLSGSQERASKGAVAALFFSGIGWVTGFNSIQYLLGSEIFPLKIRSFAQSCVMVLHFANQYGNSKALPKMMISMNKYGAFYFFSGVLGIALLWAWFFLPEVSGRSLESMDDVFQLPWYMIGRKGASLRPDHSELNYVEHQECENNCEEGPEDANKDKETTEVIEGKKD